MAPRLGHSRMSESVVHHVRNPHTSLTTDTMDQSWSMPIVEEPSAQLSPRGVLERSLCIALPVSIGQ